MKFAFSTVSCPNWDFETIAARACAYGYDGVEIRGFLNETVLTAANVFLSDASKVRGIFEQADVEIACLASSIAMTGSRRKDRQLATDLRQYIDTAQQLGCGIVKIFDRQVRPGYSRSAAAIELGDWLAPLADYAAGRDVLIVMENALSFRSSKELWFMLDRVGHPSLAICWDVFNAATTGESPHISVPTLNSRIQYTQVKDARLGPMGATYGKLGEGDVPVESFIKRLRGIGYNGWVTVEWEKAWLPGLAEPEEILPDALRKLYEWVGREAPLAEAEADSEPAAAH
jgi:sugar phosphate isomerase/epimerase